MSEAAKEEQPVAVTRWLATWTVRGESLSLMQIQGPKIVVSMHLPMAAVEAILKAGKAS